MVTETLIAFTNPKWLEYKIPNVVIEWEYQNIITLTFHSICLDSTRWTPILKRWGSQKLSRKYFASSWYFHFQADSQSSALQIYAVHPWAKYYNLKQRFTLTNGRYVAAYYCCFCWWQCWLSSRCLKECTDSILWWQLSCVFCWLWKFRSQWNTWLGERSRRE